MKKELTCLLFLLAASNGIYAKEVPENEARKAAAGFFHRGSAQRASGTNSSLPQLAHTMQEAGNNTIYVYTNPDNQGFVLIAGDDQAPEILGYAHDGTFRYETLPPNARAFLKRLSLQVDAIRKGKKAAELPVWDTEVAPLLKSKWGQTYPFNTQCPMQNGKYCVTGCVATAMAQVMYYHQWPQHGTGEVAYTTQSLKLDLSKDFSTSTYRWDLMTPEYGRDNNDESIDAVAQIMADCGYAVYMDYTTFASGADTYIMADAIVKNFNYDKGTRILTEKFYTVEEWSEMVKNELDANRPLLYGGATVNNEGHEFVCDGYNKDGLFHINWGWEGRSDGYFRLTLLDPEDQSTGGSSGNDAFNCYVDAVFGMQPPVENSTATPYTLYFDTMKASVDKKSLTVDLTNLYNYGYNDFKGEIGLEVFDLGTEQIHCKGTKNLDTLESMYGFELISLRADLPQMPNGTYGIRIISVDHNDTKEILRGLPSEDKVYLHVSDTGFSITNQLPTGIRENATAETAVYVSKAAQRVYLTGNAAIARIEIYSMQGNRLLETAEGTSIAVNGLPSGCYLIRWKTQYGWETAKFCY